MTDAERTIQTAQVLTLLDESFRARAAGDRAMFNTKARAACALDVDCVTVIQGGIMLGEIPDPEQDYPAWAEYVAAAQDEASRAEVAT